MNFYSRWKFTILLAAMLLVVTTRMAMPADSIDEILLDIFGIFLVVAAIMSICTERRFRLAALVVGSPVIVLMLAMHAFPRELGGGPQLVGRALAAFFLSFTVVMILRAVLTVRVATWDTIVGAFAGYVLIGIIWTQLFCALELASPGSFALATSPSGLPASALDQQAVLEYFSFATLSTVGYGDVAPVSRIARSLACFEAICGQFYLAVLVAGLVGMRVSGPAGGASQQTDGVS